MVNDERAPATTGGAPAELPGLLEQVVEYANRSKAEATRRAYASDWRHFAGWCRARRLEALPARPVTVAAYLTAHADGPGALAPSTLQRRLSAVSQYHQAAGYPTPTRSQEVRLVWRGITRTHGSARGKPTAPAVTGVVAALVATCDPTTLFGARDRAVLLLGFAAFLRRSELVRLDATDVVLVEEGLEVTVRGGAGPDDPAVRAVPYGQYEATCPVRAWLAWREATARAGLPAPEPQPAFLGVDRHGRLLPRRLSDRAVARAVKRAAARAGLDADAFSGHSLRAGIAVAAGRAGATEEEVMEQGGWRSPEVVRRYLRTGRLWEDPVAGRVGL